MAPLLSAARQAGVECVLSGSETPDGRPGVNMLICNMGYKNLEILYSPGWASAADGATAAAFSGNAGGREAV